MDENFPSKYKQPEKNTLKDIHNSKVSTYMWHAENSSIRLIILHGFSEHVKYYWNAATTFSNAGITVQAIDWPGHGSSEGIRGHIDNFNEYIYIIQKLLYESPQDLKNCTTILFGHSMGGLIASKYALQHLATIDGLILSAPLFGFYHWQHHFIKWFAKIFFKTRLKKPIVKGFLPEKLSRNINIWETYYRDSLRGHVITPQMYLNMFEEIKYIHQNIHLLDIPTLVFQGEKDKVVSAKITKKLFHQIKSKNKTLISFPKALHELMQEEEHKELLDNSIAWIKHNSFFNPK